MNSLVIRKSNEMELQDTMSASETTLIGELERLMNIYKREHNIKYMCIRIMLGCK